MQKTNHRKLSGRSALAVGLVAIALVAFGSAITLSEDPPPDPCEGEEVAEGYCRAYCEMLDCDGEPQDADTCLATLERYIELTGEAPPCEAPE